MIVYYEDTFVNYIIVNSCELFYNKNKIPIEKIYNINVELENQDESSEKEDIYILIFSELPDSFYNFNSNVKIINRSGLENENYLNWQFFWIEAKNKVIENYRFNENILNKLIMPNKHNRAIQEFCNYIYKTNKESLNKFDISEESAYRQGFSLLKSLNNDYKDQHKNSFIFNETIFIMGSKTEYIYNLLSESKYENIYMFEMSFNVITIYACVKNHTIPFNTLLKKYEIEETQISIKDFYNILSTFFSNKKIKQKNKLTT